MSKGEEKAAMATIGVEVTPSAKIRSDEIECDFTGNEVEDDAIFLDTDTTYTINFNLDPHGPHSWNEDNPFGARTGKCPRPDAPPHGQVRWTDVTPKQLTVQARANRRAVVHYRLNFADGTSCDPIIIIG